MNLKGGFYEKDLGADTLISQNCDN